MLRFVVIAVAAVSPTHAQYPAPSDCAFLLLESVSSLTRAVYDILQSSADCTLPGLSQRSCAADLTDMMSWWFQISTSLCGASLACGSLDNECGAAVSLALTEISDTSRNLVATSTDCLKDPFVCSYDVVTAVDELNFFVAAVIRALGFCNMIETAPPPSDLLSWYTNAQSNRRLFAVTALPSEAQVQVQATEAQAQAELERAVSLRPGASAFAVHVEAKRDDFSPPTPIDRELAGSPRPMRTRAASLAEVAAEGKVLHGLLVHAKAQLEASLISNGIR